MEFYSIFHDEPINEGLGKTEEKKVMEKKRLSGSTTSTPTPATNTQPITNNAPQQNTKPVKEFSISLI